ncbi:MAG: hypothetical protein CVU92_06820 [Firmicutes bacterium HGW-Firmicutes-17]|nr:MAG: hypothetical protein CVU92_06820 [Firmicutes bacterium HGW-Firmicutes-17]
MVAENINNVFGDRLQKTENMFSAALKNFGCRKHKKAYSATAENMNLCFRRRWLQKTLYIIYIFLQH